jgi:hypothetical protein
MEGRHRIIAGIIAQPMSLRAAGGGEAISQHVIAMENSGKRMDNQ